MQSKKRPVIVQESLIDLGEAKKETLEQVLAPFRTQEWVPQGRERAIVEAAFPHSKIIHTYSSRHYLLLSPVYDLLNAPHSKWKYNRPANIPRCEDMAQEILIAKKPLDTVFCLSYNNRKITFEMVDANNRVTALDIIKKRSEHHDLITSGEYGEDLSWLFQSHVILSVKINATDEENMAWFRTLNKIVPVPDLYLRDEAKDKREAVQAEVDRWSLEFKSHFSSTNTPNRPNTNITQFTEILSNIWEKLDLSEETKERLHQRMDQLNTHISKNIPKGTTEPQKKKCTLSGCWLFLYTAEQLVKMA
jgi:Txe/YoeB family toxin of Txe-Axe toxin-antitoxin module